MNKVLTIENIRNAKRQTLEKKNSGWIRTGARSSRLAKQFFEVSPLQGSRCTNCFFNGDRMGDIYIYIWYVYRWRYIWVSICIYLLFMRRLYIYTSIFRHLRICKKRGISRQICPTYLWWNLQDGDRLAKSSNQSSNRWLRRKRMSCWDARESAVISMGSMGGWAFPLKM